MVVQFADLRGGGLARKKGYFKGGGGLIPQSTLWYRWLVRVQLPSTNTQEHLPVDYRDIATAEKLKKWKYLDKLKPVECR